MSSTYLGTSERSFVHWDALLAIVQGAAVPGGALAGVNLVESVAPPEQNVFPCVGIQFSGYTEKRFAQNRRFVVSTFDIVVAVQLQFNALAPSNDTISQALATLRPLVNDGHGNGMSPLLRAQTTLGNACNSSYISSLEYLVTQSSASTSTAIASAAYRFVTEDTVSIR